MKTVPVHVHIRRLVVDAAEARTLSSMPGALEAAIEASLQRFGMDDVDATARPPARDHVPKGSGRRADDALPGRLGDAIAQRIIDSVPK